MAGRPTRRPERGATSAMVITIAIVIGAATALSFAVANDIHPDQTAGPAVAAPPADPTTTTTSTTSSTVAPTTTTTAAMEKRAVVTTSTTGTAPINTAPPAATGGTRSWSWDYLADCESGDWDANRVPIHGTARWDDRRGGYEGGVHFAPPTWDGFRDDDMPEAAYLASRDVQIVVAERVLAKQGPGAWPTCSYKVGMR